MDDRSRSEFACLSVSSVNGKLGVEGRATCRFDHPPNLTASWSWDGDRLEVRSDALGFRPLYYWAAPGRVIVAVHPTLQRIKNHLSTPVALSVFLRTGLFLGDDTPFRGVR